MNFSRQKAVSPIIASLLLIAIAVAAGIIVYVYVNSLAGNLTGGGGNQESQQIQLQSYSFNPVAISPSTGFSSSGTAGSGQTVDVFLENTGSSAIAINAIYFDGTQLTEWGAGTYAANLQVPSSGAGVGCYALLTTATTASAITTSTTSTVVVGSTTLCTGTAGTCSTGSAFCIVPSTTTETSLINPQTTVQLIIGLSHAFPVATSGTSHTIKLITATGGQAVFTVTAGRSG